MIYTPAINAMSIDSRKSASSIERLSDVELKAYLHSLDYQASIERALYGQPDSDTTRRIDEAESLYLVRLAAVTPIR